MAKTFFKLNDKQKASVAKHLQQAEINKLPPAARAAQKQANASGQAVGYIGGSGHNSAFATNKGMVQPMAPLPKFPSTKPAEEPAKTSSAQTAAPAYDPTPLTIGGAEGYEMPEIKFPEMAPQMFAPGGAGAGVDGNAAGFRRKKSSARMAGMTSKGTGQFKITGQSGKSSGLNIGA
jgi:hypothetical protein